MGLSEGRLEHLCDVLIKELERKKIPCLLGDGKERRKVRERARERLKDIHKQFESQEKVREKFGEDFYEFFDELLKWSYKLRLDENSRNGRPAFEEREDYPEEGLMVGKVDMFCLIDYLIKNYPKKYVGYNNFRKERRIKKGKGGSLEVRLTAKFEENFWDNIYNDYDSYEGEDGRAYCIFNRAKHSIASYLHSAHPNIHYLNIYAEGRKKLIGTAILMEGSGSGKGQAREEPYLIVEGVLGNFGELKGKKEEIYGFIWESIKDFAGRKGKRRIFINTCHSGNQIEPEEFIDFVFKKEKIAKKEKLKGGIREEKGRRVFKLEKSPETGILEDKGGDAWFTHHFSFLSQQTFIEQISNKDREHFLYGGEQYGDIFFLNNKKEFPTKEYFNSFFTLGGLGQGFEVKTPKRIMGNEKAVYSMGFATLAALAGLSGGIISEIPEMIREKPILCYDGQTEDNRVRCKVRKCIKAEELNAGYGDKGEGSLGGKQCLEWGEEEKSFLEREIRRHDDEKGRKLFTDNEEGKTYELVLLDSSGREREVCKAPQLLKQFDEIEEINLTTFKIVNSCLRAEIKEGKLNCLSKQGRSIEIDLGKLVSMEEKKDEELGEGGFGNILLLNYKGSTSSLEYKLKGGSELTQTVLEALKDIYMARKMVLDKSKEGCKDFPIKGEEKAALKKVIDGYDRFYLGPPSIFHIETPIEPIVFNGKIYFFSIYKKPLLLYTPEYRGLDMAKVKYLDLTDVVGIDEGERYSVPSMVWYSSTIVTHQDGKLDLFQANEFDKERFKAFAGSLWYLVKRYNPKAKREFFHDGPFGDLW